MTRLIIRSWRTNEVLARKQLAKATGKSITWEVYQGKLIIHEYHSNDVLYEIDLSRYGSMTFTIES